MKERHTYNTYAGINAPTGSPQYASAGATTYFTYNSWLNSGTSNGFI